MNAMDWRDVRNNDPRSLALRFLHDPYSWALVVLCVVCVIGIAVLVGTA